MSECTQSVLSLMVQSTEPNTDYVSGCSFVGHPLARSGSRDRDDAAGALEF